MKLIHRSKIHPIIIEKNGLFYITVSYLNTETMISCMNSSYKPLVYSSLKNAEIMLKSTEYWKISSISGKNTKIFKKGEYKTL